MNIEQAIDEAAHASDARLRKSYEVALAHGATNTACRPDEERLYGTLRLMTLAILRLPDLAMIAQLMHIDNEDRVVLRAACDVAGGALRLAHRALETHGRDVGYEIGAWIDDALLTAAVELAREHDEVPVVIEQVRLATLALTQAAAATGEDRMLVPDRLAEESEALARGVRDRRAAGRCDSNPILARRRTMNSNPGTLIACESVLDPILEQLTTVLDEHSANFAGPVAEALERLRSTAAEASLTISAAILETLGPVPPRRRWALVVRRHHGHAG